MSEEQQTLARWVDPTIDDFKISLEEANKQIDILGDKIQDLQNQLQQKENIIKEVRENINKKLNVNSDYVDYDFGTELLRQELLEILDKENK